MVIKENKTIIFKNLEILFVIIRNYYILILLVIPNIFIARGLF